MRDSFAELLAEADAAKAVQLLEGATAEQLAELESASFVSPGSYDRHKERVRKREAARSASGRDIGPLPGVADQVQRDSAQLSFRVFCEAYFPVTFDIPWSDDHLATIVSIERAVLEGGLYAVAMPRGTGKTTLAETACLWALVYGHREFVALIGADEGHAVSMLDALKTELGGNDKLAGDFPEVCEPVRRLEGIHNRSAGQTCDGVRTQLTWTQKEIVLPTVAGSAASGGVVRVAGITGRIRGMKFKRPDGRQVRPSLVVIDDPQTDESARSFSQCAAREGILAGAILGLAGPGSKIAGVMPCTVITPGDMADRILDREKHPEWNGERFKMLYEFPTNEKLWDEYAEIRASGLQAGDGGKSATEFYSANREAMDEGSRVGWVERHDPDEVSAVQHAMNKFLTDQGSFWSEYQNEPKSNDDSGDLLTSDEIATKCNGLARGVLPIGIDQLTAFVDVQQRVLFWLVAAWADDFTGYVLDYGAFPDQKREYYALGDVSRTLGRAFKGAGVEGAIFGGLNALANDLCRRDWKREDGALLRLSRVLVDANWQTDVIYQFCRQTDHAAVMPGHGRYVGAASKPFSEYKRQRGDRLGHNWRIPSIVGKRTARHVAFDANYWKSFVHARLAVPLGDKGSLSLFGKRKAKHRMLSDHLVAEYRVRTEGRGRVVDEWKLRPEKPDNHWLDCLVGSAVAASVEGCVLPGTAPREPPKKARRRKVSAVNW